MEVWLSWQNNKERLRLPVLPYFEVKVGNMNTRVNINELGNINLIGKSDLREMILESFFPAQEYYFVEYNAFPSPYECVNMIEKWRNSGKPIRLIITDTPINIAMAIDNFSYGERDGSGDVYFSLELAEYVFTNVKANSKSYGYIQTNIRPAKEIPNTYVTKKNDNPITVAKKTTGNSANAVEIIDRNPQVSLSDYQKQALIQLKNTALKSKNKSSGGGGGIAVASIL